MSAPRRRCSLSEYAPCTCSSQCNMSGSGSASLASLAAAHDLRGIRLTLEDALHGHSTEQSLRRRQSSDHLNTQPCFTVGEVRSMVRSIQEGECRLLQQNASSTNVIAFNRLHNELSASMHPNRKTSRNPLLAPKASDLISNALQSGAPLHSRCRPGAAAGELGAMFVVV